MTFTWIPDFGAKKTSAPHATKVQFGDGYEARQAAGLNTNPKNWTLSFSNRQISEIDAIEAFLDSCGGLSSFDWVPPRDTNSYKFVCRTWSRSFDHGQIDSLTATFEMVYEP